MHLSSHYIICALMETLMLASLFWICPLADEALRIHNNIALALHFCRRLYTATAHLECSKHSTVSPVKVPEAHCDTVFFFSLKKMLKKVNSSKLLIKVIELNYIELTLKKTGF